MQSTLHELVHEHTLFLIKKAMEVDLDVTAVLGNVRCKRFSIMVEDGKATKVNIEPDGTGATCSLADNILG